MWVVIFMEKAFWEKKEEEGGRRSRFWLFLEVMNFRSRE
jgi:hypothetical protein